MLEQGKGTVRRVGGDGEADCLGRRKFDCITLVFRENIWTHKIGRRINDDAAIQGKAFCRSKRGEQDNG